MGRLRRPSATQHKNESAALAILFSVAAVLEKAAQRADENMVHYFGIVYASYP